LNPGYVFDGNIFDAPYTGNLTLTTFDVTNPRSPVMKGNVTVGSMQPDGCDDNVSLGGGFYVLSCNAPDLTYTGPSLDNSLVIVDARDPGSPQAYIYDRVQGLSGLAISNGYLYAATVAGANIYKIQPVVPFVGAIPNLPNPRIAIEGSNFGTLSSFTGTSTHFRFRDLSGNWEAGYQAPDSLIPDACSVTISEWATTRIAVIVNSGALLCSQALNLADRVELDVCNAQSTTCVPTSSSTGAAKAFQTITGQLTFTLEISPLLSPGSLGGPSVAFTAADLNGMTLGIVDGLAAEGIAVRDEDIGYAMVQTNTDFQSAVSEATFLISAPSFFSDIVDTLQEAPELLPISFVQQFGVPSPPDIIADLVNAVGDSEATLKQVTSQWCATQDLNQVPEYLLTNDGTSAQELQVTISNLTRMPASLTVPVSDYVLTPQVVAAGPATCTPDTSGASLAVDQQRSSSGVAVSLAPAS
jgi:hypothetical protein